MTRIHYAKMMFPGKTTQAGGFLPPVMEAHACYYYAVCAHKHLQSAMRGAIFEGEDDHTTRLDSIARSIAVVYGLESPSDFLKHINAVRAQVTIVERGGWDRRVEDPYGQEGKIISITQEH